VKSRFTLPITQTWKELNGIPCIDASEKAQKQSITSMSFGEMFMDFETLKTSVAG